MSIVTLYSSPNMWTICLSTATKSSTSRLESVVYFLALFRIELFSNEVKPMSLLFLVSTAPRISGRSDYQQLKIHKIHSFNDSRRVTSRVVVSVWSLPCWNHQRWHEDNVMLDGHHPTRIKKAKASQSQEPSIIAWNGNVSVEAPHPHVTAPPQSLHVYFMWILLQISSPQMNGECMLTFSDLPIVIWLSIWSSVIDPLFSDGNHCCCIFCQWL